MRSVCLILILSFMSLSHPQRSGLRQRYNRRGELRLNGDDDGAMPWVRSLKPSSQGLYDFRDEAILAQKRDIQLRRRRSHSRDLTVLGHLERQSPSIRLMRRANDRPQEAAANDHPQNKAVNGQATPHNGDKGLSSSSQPTHATNYNHGGHDEASTSKKSQYVPETEGNSRGKGTSPTQSPAVSPGMKLSQSDHSLVDQQAGKGVARVSFAGHGEQEKEHTSRTQEFKDLEDDIIFKTAHSHLHSTSPGSSPDALGQHESPKDQTHPLQVKTHPLEEKKSSSLGKKSGEGHHISLQGGRPSPLRPRKFRQATRQHERSAGDARQVAEVQSS